ncbi:MAG TPA: VOC family protein [Ornithinibacter sp.]|jgi:PhnB protein|nr:VOC family protein [Ornithinibacter sp.]
MAVSLNPYLTFPGTAREAMTFYQSVLGGELQISTFGEFGADGPEANGVMHSHLETESGMTFMASDLPPGMAEGYSPGSTMSMSISGDDSEAIRRYWDGLAEGGTVQMPLERQMWGDDYGMLVDRFGIAWMVNIAGDPPA